MVRKNSLPPQPYSEEPESDEKRFYEQVLHRQTPGHRLRVLSLLLSRSLNARLACHEVTRIHWVVLSCLWQTDGLPVSQISQMLSQVGGSTSEVLDRMEERKLVRRRRARSDRRVCRVYLSERGEELFKILPARALPMNERMFQNFSEQEKALFSESVDKITANLKKICGLDSSPCPLKAGGNRNIKIDQATLAILPPFSVGYRLKVCSQLITRRFNDLCQPWEVNTPQWHILRCLWAEDGLPVSVVGDLVD